MEHKCIRTCPNSNQNLDNACMPSFANYFLSLHPRPAQKIGQGSGCRSAHNAKFFIFTKAFSFLLQPFEAAGTGTESPYKEVYKDFLYSWLMRGL